MLVAQQALLDQNIKLMLATIHSASGNINRNDALEEVQQLAFFDPNGPGYAEASAAWKEVIRGRFPLHLFMLEPSVEEQNYVDAFSRRRELQLAIAMAVAKENESRPSHPFHSV